MGTIASEELEICEPVPLDSIHIDGNICQVVDDLAYITFYRDQPSITNPGTIERTALVRIHVRVSKIPKLRHIVDAELAQATHPEIPRLIAYEILPN